MQDMTILEAERIVAALRAFAAQERADAQGKIHNAKISRLESAKESEELADRVEAWKWGEQERQNERARPKHRPTRRLPQAG